MSVRGSGMRKEVYCSSSRSLWRRLQELRAEVAPRAAGRICAPGRDRPYFMCERRSMGVQRARSRKVFGCEPGECMGVVY